ncbi:hypothetical protein EIP86_000602 [Pleurotus ostreatoroseus]|nr:hypothetical protein EIP86_000602 [Pleurotus ostreatoroseus]
MALIEAGYMNTGIPGLARDYWPAGISTRVDMSEDPAALETIPCSLEGVAENVVIEPYKKQGTDRSRRLGIFSSKHAEQTHFSVKFHGFIKREELKGYGNWNGVKETAFRASLKLELEGHGCHDAFFPQIALMGHLQSHVTQTLCAEGICDNKDDSVLRFQHVLFRKVTRDDRNDPVVLSRGEDPKGMLQRISRDWRLNQRPRLYKRTENGGITETTPMSFAPMDFVEVVAYPAIIFKDGRGRSPDRARVVLALQQITRLYNYMQLTDMQVPAALLQMTQLHAHGGMEEENVVARMIEELVEDNACS